MLKFLRLSIFAVMAWLALDWINYLWFKPFTPSGFFQRAWIEYVRYHPEAATITQTESILLPSSLNANLSQYDSEFDSLNQSRIARFIELINTYRSLELQGFDKIAADHLRDFLNQAFTSRSKSSISLNPLDGDHLKIQHFLVFYHQINNIGDAVNYIERVKGFANRLRLMDEMILELKEQAQIKPAFFSEMLLEQFTKLADEPVYQTKIYQDFEQKVLALNSSGTHAKHEVLKDLEFEIRHNLKPAFAKLSQSISAYRDEMASNSEKPSLENIEINSERDENKIYDDLTQIYTQTLDQIQQLSRDSLGCGLEEVWYELKPELQDVESQVGSALQELEMLSRRFGIQIELPKLMFHSSSQPFALHPLTYFGHSSQTLLVNTQNLPPEWMGHLYAEVFPGRHLQHSLAFSNPRLPTFLKFYQSSAFEDGWSVFALDLVLDSLATAKQKLSVLKVKLEKILMGICDVSIYQGQMDANQAVDFMSQQLSLDKKRAQTLVAEVLAHPGRSSAFITSYRLFRFWHNFVFFDLGLSNAEFFEGTLSHGNLHLGSSFNEWMSLWFEKKKIESLKL
jgi:uncharacterized protein (DUF885 family)